MRRNSLQIRLWSELFVSQLYPIFNSNVFQCSETHLLVDCSHVKDKTTTTRPTTTTTRHTTTTTRHTTIRTTSSESTKPTSYLLDTSADQTSTQIFDETLFTTEETIHPLDDPMTYIIAFGVAFIAIILLLLIIWWFWPKKMTIHDDSSGKSFIDSNILCINWLLIVLLPTVDDN